MVLAITAITTCQNGSAAPTVLPPRRYRAKTNKPNYYILWFVNIYLNNPCVYVDICYNVHMVNTIYGHEYL